MSEELDKLFYKQENNVFRMLSTLNEIDVRLQIMTDALELRDQYHSCDIDNKFASLMVDEMNLRIESSRDKIRRPIYTLENQINNVLNYMQDIKE